MTFITSRENGTIKQVVKLRKSAKARRENGMFIAEGLRISLDAMKSHAQILMLFVTESAIEKHKSNFEMLEEYADKVICVPQNIFSYICDTESPQGFLSIVKTLDKTSQFDTIKGDSKLLVLDNVQDPSNLGTVLRSAEAFNVSGVILSSDCCDIFSPKVVRGSMGAVFRIPFLICNTVKDFLCKHPEINSYAAVVGQNAQKITEITFTPPCAVIVGNEGNGLKAETIDSCKHKITIPMDGKAESLNASVAAAILMWEMMK